MLLLTNVLAQNKLYVCEKFDVDSHSIMNSDSVFKEFIYNDDKTQVTIGNDTYDIEDIDSIVFSKPNIPCVAVVWEGTSATVTIDPTITGVTYSTNGGHVTITSSNTKEEILYVLSGESSNGSLVLNGSYKLTMHLNGLSLTSAKGPAIDIECGKRIELKLIKGTENTLVDCSKGTQKAALFAQGHLEIKGKGTLNVTGNTKHAISAKEYLTLKSSTGTINILGAVSDGIHCGKGSSAAADYENCRFTMNGGIVNISGCGSDCVDADDYGSVFMNGGILNLKVDKPDTNGVKCDSIMRMTGGTIKMEVSDSLSCGIKHNYHSYFSGGTIEGTVSGNGSMGILAKKVTKTTGTVFKGGDIHLDGTDVTLELTGGSYKGDDCIGIAVDGDYYQTGGNIHIKVSNPEAYGIDVIGDENITGGTKTVE